MQLLFTVLFILGLAFQSFVDACSRKSARPLVDGSTTPRATITSSTTYRPIPPNRFNCTQKEKSNTGCLNGGKCFSMMLGGDRVSACKCPENYTGERCEAIDFQPVMTNDRMRIAGIAAGVTSCILVLLFIMGVIFVYLKRRTKAKRDNKEDNKEEQPKLTQDN